ncbi:unnamed protein product [Gadus morhua 'NCC']
MSGPLRSSGARDEWQVHYKRLIGKLEASPGPLAGRGLDPEQALMCDSPSRPGLGLHGRAVDRSRRSQGVCTYNRLPNGGLDLQQAPQWRSAPSTCSPMEDCAFNMLPNGGLDLQQAPQWGSAPSTGSPMESKPKPQCGSLGIQRRSRYDV